MKKLYVPNIDSLIITVRGCKAILDFDLATLYQVPTKALNQAVKRNRGKFPDDFMMALTPEEAEEARRVRSEFVTASGSAHVMRSQFVTGSKRNIRYCPYAFTEHGALMAATVLSSPRAVAMSLYVIRAFIKMREDLAANDAILKRLAEIDKTLLLHDGALRDIYQKLRPLLEPAPMSPKPQIGFHVKEDSVRYRVRRKIPAWIT